jgi:hypothetical protein
MTDAVVQFVNSLRIQHEVPATIPGLASTGSTVKVTAYGGTADTCKVTDWGGSADSASVSIACFDPTGQPVDSYFTVTYATNQFIIC